MARKQYGLKFEEADIARWDAWAADHGFSRTTFLEAAAEALIEGAVPQSTPPASPGAPPSGRRRQYFSAPETPERARRPDEEEPSSEHVAYAAWADNYTLAIQESRPTPGSSHYAPRNVNQDR